MARTTFGLCFLLALFGLIGCGSSTVPISGTVIYDGKPLKQGTIIFEAEGVRPANGKIVDGKIVEVTTFKTGDGVAPGNHKVAIQAVEEMGSAITKNPGDSPTGGNYMGGKSLLPAKYGNPAQSGLTATVTAGGENNFTFELKKGN